MSLVTALLVAALAAAGTSGARGPAANGFLAATFEPGGGPIWRVDPVTGRVSPFAARVRAHDLAWSPDGKTLMFDEEVSSQRIVLHAVDERGGLRPLQADGYAPSFSPDGR